MLGISQTTGYLIVGLAAAVIPLGSAWLATRANRETTRIDAAIAVQGSLIDDLREDRDDLRGQLNQLRGEFTDMRLKHDECERERVKLTARVAELEATP